MFEQAGFLRMNEVGATGLKLGTSGKVDGLIVGIEPGSPAASAGLAVGDAITAVDDKPVKLTPGTIAAQRTFGQRGEPLHMKVRRNGSNLDITLVRDPRTAPRGPKSPSRFMYLRPMINWQDQFIPCLGAGPAGYAAIEYCYSHFKPYGFIKTGDLGSTGFQLDLNRTDKAVVTAVESGSAAAKADVRPGDEIIEVEGKPLTASSSENASELLFGKVGNQFHVKVRTGQTEKTVVLTLAGKQKR
ncbi:MAG: PDZ domain-containing protein [Bryocella sp.]